MRSSNIWNKGFTSSFGRSFRQKGAYYQNKGLRSLPNQLIYQTNLRVLGQVLSPYNDT